MTELTYTPSIMEKLLGGWYKWWFVFRYNLIRNTNYRIDIFAFRVGDFFQILAVILAWQLQPIVRTQDAWKPIITYFIVGNIIDSFTKCYYDSLVAKKIQSGAFISELLKPQNIFLNLLTTGAGTFVFPNISSVLMVSMFIIPYYNQLIFFQGGLSDLIVLFLVVACGWFIRNCFMLFVAFITFWTTENSGINTAAKNITSIFAGSIIPFYYFPESFSWLQYNPFSFTFYHPMQIYLGKYDSNQTILVFLGGLVWCIILYFLAKLVFKLGLKRNESVGL